MNDCTGFWFLLRAPGPFSCYLLSLWSKKNNAMGPRTEQHHPVMSHNTASRVVQAEESGGGWALDTRMLLFQKTQSVASPPAAPLPQNTCYEFDSVVFRIYSVTTNRFFSWFWFWSEDTLGNSSSSISPCDFISCFWHQAHSRAGFITVWIIF